MIHDHTIEQRSVNTNHDEYEVLAQSICTGKAIAMGQNGWIYAVRRLCYNFKNTKTCRQVCSNPYLRWMDRQTMRQKWTCIGAFHVYSPRPSSAPSTADKPSMGFKVLWNEKQDTDPRCGPNFCCCMALL